MAHEIWWFGTFKCLEYFTGSVPCIGDTMIIISETRTELELMVKDVRWRITGDKDAPPIAIVFVTLLDGIIRNSDI